MPASCVAKRYKYLSENKLNVKDSLVVDAPKDINIPLELIAELYFPNNADNDQIILGLKDSIRHLNQSLLDFNSTQKVNARRVIKLIQLAIKEKKDNHLMRAKNKLEQAGFLACKALPAGLFAIANLYGNLSFLCDDMDRTDEARMFFNKAKDIAHLSKDKELFYSGLFNK